MAAGTVHTAALLQLSGIGDKAALSKFNQAVALDLPGVGNNFHDHQFVTMVYSGKLRNFPRMCRSPYMPWL